MDEKQAKGLMTRIKHWYYSLKDSRAKLQDEADQVLEKPEDREMASELIEKVHETKDLMSEVAEVKETLAGTVNDFNHVATAMENYREDQRKMNEALAKLNEAAQYGAAITKKNSKRHCHSCLEIEEKHAETERKKGNNGPFNKGAEIQGLITLIL